jgi:hypothetical protein
MMMMMMMMMIKGLMGERHGSKHGLVPMKEGGLIWSQV